MDWSAETVEGLAPDAASVTAARKLARPGPWSATGHDERAVWGLCKGSRARSPTRRRSTSPGRPTSARARAGSSRASTRWRCCCCGRAGTSRRRPRPAWVREWLARRGERAARAASRPAPGEAPRDPEAAARRAAEREARVAAGVEDLRRWLRDAVRGGLGAGRLRAWDEWDAFAARLVDAQAPGAASRLRSLGRRRRGAARRLAGAAALRPRPAAPAVRGVRARRRAGARRRPRAAGLERRPRGGAGRPARARPLGRARPHRDRAGAPARAAHLALGAGDRPARAAAGLRAAGRAAGAAPGARHGDGRPCSRSTRARRRCARSWPTPAPLEPAPGAFGTGGADDGAAHGRAAVASNPWLEEWPVVLAPPSRTAATAVLDARR